VECGAKDQKFNPLTTDDECTCHVTLAACYQLAQSVLKIGFVLAKKGGIRGGGWVHRELPCTWQLPWLAVEKPWSALAWPFLHMAAALAGCRKALVGTGLAISAHGSCLGWL